MPLAVAKPLEVNDPHIAASELDAARAYLRNQAAKPLEQRVTDIEVWQLGANQVMSEISDIHDIVTWIKTASKKWVPLIAAAAIGSGLIGGKGAAFAAALLKAAGISVG